MKNGPAWVSFVTVTAVVLLTAALYAAGESSAGYVPVGSRVPKGRWALFIPERGHNGNEWFVDVSRWMALPYWAASEKVCREQIVDAARTAHALVHTRFDSVEAQMKWEVSVVQLNFAKCLKSDGSARFVSDTPEHAEKSVAEE